MAGTTQLQLPDWVDLQRWDSYQCGIYEEICGLFDDGNSLVCLDAPVGMGKSLVAETVGRYLDVPRIYNCTTKTLMDQFARSFPEAKLIKGRANYHPLDVTPGPWNITPTCAECDRVEDGCSYCYDTSLCPYTVARDNAASAELVCTNTAYFMGECSSPKTKFSGRPFVILDEADLAEQEVMGQVSVEISPRMQSLLDLSPPRFKTAEAREGRKSWEDWFEYAIPLIRAKRDSIKKRGLADTKTDLAARRQHQSLTRLLEKMEEIEGNLDGWIYDYSDRVPLAFKPIMVDKIAPEVLWRHGEKWLAMSATMPPDFIETMGYTGSHAWVMAPSTFPKERRPIYYIPSARMISKMEATESPKMIPAVKATLQVFPERSTLIHAHSYKLTKLIVEGLNGIDRPLFHYMEAKDRQRAIDDFENSENGILVASSLDRGYDGKDEKVRLIIMPKVPAPYLGDKQVSTRLFKTPTGDYWYSSRTSQTIQQMIGRGMRHEEDECTVVILDSQFGKFYAKWNGRNGNGHRLFRSWFTEALHFQSDVEFEVKQAIRELVRG